MRTFLLLSFFVSIFISAKAQNNNPLYWKNKKPNSDYWQQDVHYTIKAKIDEKTDVLNGSMILEYTNNSPDELPFVYFHLYNNAFQPGSYYDDLLKNNKVEPKYGPYEKRRLGTVIAKVEYNGQKVKPTFDNTIMRIDLPQPIKSGETVKFNIDFLTFFDGFGSVRRRMKVFYPFGYKHYDGVHWYPRMDVYDRKFGWTPDQHFGHEYYGDYGTFDVELTFNSSFILDATGNLLNEQEVLPEDLKQKIDIKNFKDKPLYSKPSEIIPYDSTKTKTWKFRAENVHDFAFTADPTYRMGVAYWNGVKCVALAQESNAAKWQDAANYTARIIECFSNDFGKYEYPKMIVADARDGMEYPMLTLDGGFEPDHHDLLIHEIAHNWFFGMIGNNETYRAFLDEGFTQFLTVWGLEKLDGKKRILTESDNFWVKKFDQGEIAREGEVYNAYMRDAIRFKDEPLNQHSDAFNGAVRHGGGYSNVYHKTAVMLFNLQYVLGDELFQNAMKNYVSQWKMAHPYPEDFRNSIIQFTKVDLNWFFDQWLETSKNIDYSIEKIKKGKEKNQYEITFKRKGRMHMPLDFTVTDKAGKKYNYYIPNTWFKKNTAANILPKWEGWDNIFPTYKATVLLDNSIKNVEIDTSGRLADINALNNSKKCPQKLYFDSKVFNLADRKNYVYKWRPTAWYNGYDGFKLGIHLNGSYFQYLHNFELDVWYNSRLAQNNSIRESQKTYNDLLSFRLKYNNGLDKVMKGLSWNFEIKQLDGLSGGHVGLKQKFGNNRKEVYAFAKVLYRNDSTDLNYLIYKNEWNPEKFNNTFNIGYNYFYQYKKGSGNLNIHLRTPFLLSDYNYSQISITAKNQRQLGKFDFKSRVFVQYTSGTNIASESQLFLAGANNEELMENAFTRSIGFLPNNFAGFGNTTNHFQMGGGLNVRGYAGYLVPENDENGNQILTYKGHSGASVNTEIDFQRAFGLRFRQLGRYVRLNTYLFGDAGVISTNAINDKNLKLASLRASAGLGATLSFINFGPIQDVKPLVFRVDFPMFLNRTPATEPEYLKFRWLIGISRAF